MHARSGDVDELNVASADRGNCDIFRDNDTASAEQLALMIGIVLTALIKVQRQFRLLQNDALL